MKKVFFLICMMIVASITANAQVGMPQEDINRSVKEDTKALVKEGWKVDAGEMPLHFQLRRAYTMNQEVLPGGKPKYFMGKATALGNSSIGAYATARQFAISDLVKQIEVIYKDDVQAGIINNGLGEGSTDYATQIIASSVLKIGNFVTVVSCYREKDKNVIEAQIRIACSREDVEKAIFKTMDMLKNEEK